MKAKRELNTMELGMVNGGSWLGDVFESACEAVATASQVATSVVEKITGVEAIKEAPEIYKEFTETYVKTVTG